MFNLKSSSKLGATLLALILGASAFMAGQVWAAKYVIDPTTGKAVTAPEYGGTITFATRLTPPTFDPLFHPWAYLANSGVVESLAIVNWAIDRNELDIRSPAFRPVSAFTGELAESWETPDAKTIIFHIRQGVNWHNKAPMNGREFDAKDVEYNLHRVFALGSGWTAENKPPVQYGQAFTSLPVESIAATDKWTVVIKLKEPNVGALFMFLDHWATVIMPPEVIKQYGDVQDWRNVVGTGPYELTDYVEGSSITWTKNPDYWGYDEKYPENRLPYADEISALFMNEPATRLAAFRSGKLDMLGHIGDTQIRSIDTAESLAKTNPEIELWPYAYRSTNSLAMDTITSPFSDIRVRKAMQMALDHETINDTFYKGYGMWKPQGLIGDGTVGYNTPFEEWPEELQQEYTYNPERAEALLDDAGYPRGPDGVRFKTDVVVIESEYYELALAYFAEIGVVVEFDVVDGPTYGARVSSGAHDFEGLVTAASGMDYSNVLLPLEQYSVKGYDYPGGMNPEYEALYEAAVAATTIEEQQRAVKAANMYIVANHWNIWGTKVPAFNAAQPWLKGYNGESELGGVGRVTYVARLWIDQDLKKQMGY